MVAQSGTYSIETWQLQYMYMYTPNLQCKERDIIGL